MIANTPDFCYSLMFLMYLMTSGLSFICGSELG